MYVYIFLEILKFSAIDKLKGLTNRRKSDWEQQDRKLVAKNWRRREENQGGKEEIQGKGRRRRRGGRERERERNR